MMFDQPNWRDHKFEHVVTDLIRRKVLFGTVSFSDLIRQLPGVYPTLALASLRHLAKSRQIDACVLSNIEQEIAADPSPFQDQEQEHYISFPVPHPLDYDWRFADCSTNYLLTKCLELSTDNQLITMLGTPGLMRAAIESGAQRRVVLLDADARLVRSFSRQVSNNIRVIQNKIGANPLPTMQANVVVADPPWYEDFLDPFLFAASQLCAVGGYVVLAIPPLGTRAGIWKERDRLRANAELRGFEWLESHEGAIRYSSPLFERNSLRQAGIRNIPLDWRCGDVVVLKLRSRVSSLHAPKLPRCNIWTEYIIDGVRIRVYPGSAEECNDPSLTSLVPNDVLPTVSRSEHVRSQVRVWTSGNRVYGCRGRTMLRTILRAMEDCDNVGNGRDPRITPHDAVLDFLQRDLTSAESALIDKCVAQIEDIIKRESEENRHLTCEVLLI